MANTQITTSHDITAEQFNDRAFREYVDKLVLKPFMGTSTESVIHVNEDLMKSPGDAITFNLVAQLDGSGVEGEGDMEGNEEALSMYGHRVELQEYKNAVRLAGGLTVQRSPFDIKMEAMPNLTTWMAQKTESLHFAALASISGTVYASASESTKDTYLASNSDRFLFGAAVANNAGNDHSACLAEIDSTNDILSVAQISLAKRLAQLANPKIRPIRLENGEEIYVMFVHPYCARDLKNSTTWINAQQYARNRGSDNPLFSGALGEWDGVILVESPKCILLDNVGASSIDVAGNFLCGAQSVLHAQGGYGGAGRTVLTEKLFDYDSRWGCQIKTMQGIEKAIFNSKQNGVVTVYSAAVAD